MKSEEVKDRLVLQHHQVYNPVSTKEIPKIQGKLHSEAYYPGITQLLFSATEGCNNAIFLTE